MRTTRLLTLAALAAVLAGCASTGDHPSSPAKAPGSAAAPSTTAPPRPSSSSSAPLSPSGVPRPDHVIVAVLENASYEQIVGRPEAPFLDRLESRGAVFTHSYAITHPSQPNYLALFSGSTQGLSDDSCPHTYASANLGRALLDAGHSFVGYSEDLPSTGFTGCSAGKYARKHNPWADFNNLPPRVNQPMTAFPSNLAALPTVSFVIPNLDHDLHDGTLNQADQWLRAHLGSYLDWAPTHNSLLILTNDEDDFTTVNRIATIIVGAHVIPGSYPGRVDHYSVLRTIEDAYGLTPIGASAQARPITAIWSR